MEVSENDVFVGKTGHRRIIGIIEPYIYYSIGGDSNGACLYNTFKRWVKDNNAKSITKEKV